MKPLSVRASRQASFKVLLIVCLLLSMLFGNSTSTVYANPDSGSTRVPTNPFPSPAVDSTLTRHELTYAPSPLDNPLKGFAPFYPWEAETSFPHSLEWYYIPLKAVMDGPDSYTFDTGIEPVLNAIAARGNQAALRVYLEYPGKEDAIPDFIHQSDVEMRYNDTFDQIEPDYDDPLMVTYLTNFIKAFGAEYDGDPRIGFIHMGLVGLWGEWHTYPYDEDDADGLPNYMPSANTIRALFDAYDSAFDQTKLEVRYPGLPGASEYNIGYHDDSFGFKEGDPLQSVTQPESMGGAYYSFLTKMLDAGSENKWITQSVGGEVRPEIQTEFFTGGANVDDAMDDIELTHATWMINHSGIGTYNANDAAVAAGVRKMGYDLHVKSAHYNDVAQGDPLKVGVTIENNGVAPFTYPWQVELGVKNAKGNLVKQWDTTWDMTKVMPMEIRTYPEWELPDNPKYVPFGEPYYFDTTIPAPDLNDGYYYLVMKVINPLEAISSKAKRVGFANTDQDQDGWLNLGPVLIGQCASPCVTPPQSPPPPPERLLVDNYDGTPPWSGNTQNDLNQWSGSSGFANGDGAGIIEDDALVLQYQNMSRLETNIGRNVTDTPKLVIRAKGASGGEENEVSLTIGGITKTLAQFSGDTITTSYKDIVIDLTNQGIDLSQTIWSIALFQAAWDTTGTIYIDEIYFTDRYDSDTDPGTNPSPDLNKPGLIEDFESYSDDAALGLAWTEAWSDIPGSVTRTLGESSGSKGLELSVAIAESEWANTIYSIPTDKRNWSAFDGLSFWVNNTSTDNKDFSLNVALQTPVAKGEFGLKEGGSALTIAADGSWQTVPFNGSSLNVPAGFEGVLKISWDEFVQAAWQCDGIQADCTAALDPSDVTGLQFGYPPAGYVNNVITIDDIILYRADKILEDFESYSDDAALQNIWRIDWENGAPSALRTLDTENYSDGSQAMKLSVSPPSDEAVSEWVNIKRAAFTGTDSDWSAFDGLTFWVNNTSPSGNNMNMALAVVTDASKGEFSLKQGTAVELYSSNGWNPTTLDGASLVIEAGFSGMVRIPWSAFSQSTWQGCDACDAEFDTSQVLQVQFGFAPNTQIDTAFTIDQLGLYALSGRTNDSGGEVIIDPIERPTPPAWATNEGSYALEYQQAPVDNPLKGFLPFYDASEEAYFTEGDDWRTRETQIPYSLEFFYLPLRQLMNNLDDFDWTELDKRLNGVASRGNQAVFRVYLDYPNKDTGIPQFLLDGGLQTFEYEDYLNGQLGTSIAPDYNDENLLEALDNFIAALGERYDGDPRVGFIMIGLIGFWGEWHTYPYDGNIQSPNLMPTDENLNRVLVSMDNAFNETQLVLRYPMENSVLKTKNFDVGYHDDSFAFQTLHPGLGGQSWHFWGRVRDAGVTEFWKQNSMGGEMRPEIQLKMWEQDPPIYNEPSTPIEGRTVGEDYYTSLNLTHASWMIVQGIFQTPLEAEPLARAIKGSQDMGYDYYVPNAYMDGTNGNLKVAVELENKGIAPFYYNWKVELAAQDEHGIAAIWETDWDLKGVLPNRDGHGYENNKLFESIDNPELSNGSYDILMRYVNPLEAINADSKKFHFANVEQQSNGWLKLGKAEVSNSITADPVRVTALTAHTASALQLSPGSDQEISVAIEPAEANNQRIVWSSTNSNVAIVSASGLVTAISAGNVVITATSADGNFEKSFSVTVGSSSTSGESPALPITPAPEATKNGIKLEKDAIAIEQKTNDNGIKETIATVDGKKLEEAFNTLSNRANNEGANSVIIELENNGGNVIVDIPSSALIGTSNKLVNASIIVQVDFGSYTVPVQALDLLALTKQLDAEPEDITIRIVINKIAGDMAELLSQQASKEDLTLLASAEFNIIAQAKDKSIELSHFDNSYLERTLHLPGVFDFANTTAVLFDPEKATFDFVPSVLQHDGANTEVFIKRNGNSIYAVVSGSKTFDDIQDHWGKSDIELLASKRIINGYTSNHFSPDKPITRAEFTALLIRSLGLSSTGNLAAFSDVASDDWYADTVATAVDREIIKGFADGSFRPNELITREQAAVMLARALHFINQSSTVNEHVLANYSDSSSISFWAKDAVAELIQAQIMKGHQHTIAPLSNASRVEVAVMLRRFLQYAQFIN